MLLQRWLIMIINFYLCPMFREINPKEIPTKHLHEVLLGCIAPRPIAWVSTINLNNEVNLAPFSFFNVFGSNPPIVIFSPARRVKDNSTKHTLQNIEATKECVINISDYKLTGQMVLSSTEYFESINEFEKIGLGQADTLTKINNACSGFKFILFLIS